MTGGEQVAIERDVEASVVPSGTRVTLEKGETATITQSLGGTFTVVVNGNMFRIDGKDADAIGQELQLTPAEQAGKAENAEDLEQQVWEQMKTCYDPEIPVNIVDLGLIYDCHLEELEAGNYKASVKMTLTAPGCGNPAGGARYKCARAAGRDRWFRARAVHTETVACMALIRTFLCE